MNREWIDPPETEKMEDADERGNTMNRVMAAIAALIGTIRVMFPAVAEAQLWQIFDRVEQSEQAQEAEKAVFSRRQTFQSDGLQFTVLLEPEEGSTALKNAQTAKGWKKTEIDGGAVVYRLLTKEYDCVDESAEGKSAAEGAIYTYQYLIQKEGIVRTARLEFSEAGRKKAPSAKAFYQLLFDEAGEPRREAITDDRWSCVLHYPEGIVEVAAFPMPYHREMDLKLWERTEGEAPIEGMPEVTLFLGQGSEKMLIYASDWAAICVKASPKGFVDETLYPRALRIMQMILEELDLKVPEKK